MSNKRYDLTRTVQNGTDCATGGPEVDFVYSPAAAASDEGASVSARLLYVSSSCYEGDWQSLLHRHAFMEIFLILDGQGRFQIGNESLHVHKDDFILINPLAEHAEYSVESAPLSYIVIAVEGLQFTQPDANTCPYFLIHGVSDKMKSYVRLLLAEISDPGYGYDVVCQNLMNIILVLVLGHKRTGLAITRFQNISSKCAAAKEYLDNHFKEPVSLDDLAAAVHQSKFHLAHAFRSTFGVSPMRYLVDRRLNESKHLLSQTNYSIGEIATITGFSSASLFSQTFKRLTALTPNEYRRLSERSRKDA